MELTLSLTLKSAGKVVKDITTLTLFPLVPHVIDENPSNGEHDGEVGAVNYVGNVIIKISLVT